MTPHAASSAQAPDGPDQRIAVGREREGPLNDALDAGLADRREVLEADLEARRDTVEVVGQQLGSEVPRRGVGRPWLAARS